MKTRLLEMFGTKAYFKWNQTTVGEEGHFELDNQKLKIILNEYDSIKLKSGTESGDITEIAFSRNINGQDVIKKTETNDSIKIFSIIFNGILDKFKSSKFPKTILFSAKKIGDVATEYDKRFKLYSKLQDRISRFGYEKFEPIENSTGTHFILTNLKLNKSDIENFKQIICKL